MERINELIQALEEISPILDDDDPALTVDLVKRYCDIVDEVYATFREQGVQVEDAWIIPPLIRSFGHGTTHGCAWCVLHTLELFSSEILRPALRQAVQTEAHGARKWCAYMLGVQRNPEDVCVLIGALKDPDQGVRIDALAALCMIGDLSARAAMEELLEDPVEEVRKIAREDIEALLDQRYVFRRRDAASSLN